MLIAGTNRLSLGPPGIGAFERGVSSVCLKKKWFNSVPVS